MSDEIETIDKNQKSWAAWKREAERLQAIIDDMALAAMDSEPVIVVGDDGGDALSYRRLIQSFEPGTKLYLHAQPSPVVQNGLRLALSNAGIAAPESDEMLAATYEKHIQALVTWVKDRKPFQSAPVVPEEIKRNPETGWYVGPDGKNWSALQANSWNACRAAMLQAGNSPVIPDGSASMLRRWLAFCRGMQNAGSQLPHRLS